jgi:hypothetical protein
MPIALDLVHQDLAEERLLYLNLTYDSLSEELRLLENLNCRRKIRRNDAILALQEPLFEELSTLQEALFEDLSIRYRPAGLRPWTKKEIYITSVNPAKQHG